MMSVKLIGILVALTCSSVSKVGSVELLDVKEFCNSSKEVEIKYGFKATFKQSDLKQFFLHLIVPKNARFAILMRISQLPENSRHNPNCRPLKAGSFQSKILGKNDIAYNQPFIQYGFMTTEKDKRFILVTNTNNMLYMSHSKGNKACNSSNGTATIIGIIGYGLLSNASCPHSGQDTIAVEDKEKNITRIICIDKYDSEIKELLESFEVKYTKLSDLRINNFSENESDNITAMVTIPNWYSSFGVFLSGWIVAIILFILLIAIIVYVLVNRKKAKRNKSRNNDSNTENKQTEDSLPLTSLSKDMSYNLDSGQYSENITGPESLQVPASIPTQQTDSGFSYDEQVF